jgi:hypothetical protein
MFKESLIHGSNAVKIEPTNERLQSNLKFYEDAAK